MVSPIRKPDLQAALAELAARRAAKAAEARKCESCLDFTRSCEANPLGGDAARPCAGKLAPLHKERK